MCIIKEDGDHILIGRFKTSPLGKLEINMYGYFFSKHLNFRALMDSSRKKAELGSLLLMFKSKRCQTSSNYPS